MTEATMWWFAACGLIAVELVTGTFFLLMLSVGPIAGALVAHAGLSPTWQWAMAAVAGGGSVLAWYGVKKSQKPAVPLWSDGDTSLDVGQTVHVDGWRDDGTCMIKYRGAQWSAILQAGEAASTGTHCIVAVDGNRLILKKFHHP